MVDCRVIATYRLRDEKGQWHTHSEEPLVFSLPERTDDLGVFEEYLKSTLGIEVQKFHSVSFRN